jgi:hypothetical protein
MLRCGAPCIADNQRAALGLHSPAAKVAPSDQAGRAKEENADSSAPSTVLAETEGFAAATYKPLQSLSFFERLVLSS